MFSSIPGRVCPRRLSWRSLRQILSFEDILCLFDLTVVVGAATGCDTNGTALSERWLRVEAGSVETYGGLGCCWAGSMRPFIVVVEGYGYVYVYASPPPDLPTQLDHIKVDRLLLSAAFG